MSAVSCQMSEVRSQKSAAYVPRPRDYSEPRKSEDRSAYAVAFRDRMEGDLEELTANYDQFG